MKKKKIFKFILIIILMLFISGCGDDTPKGIYDESGNPVFIEDYQYEMLHTNPNNFKGKFVELSGQVFTNPERDEDKIAFQMFVDVENYDKNIIVYYNGNVSIKKDDYVIITGYVLGEHSGTNALGGTVTAPMIYAENVVISNYKDVVSPTKKLVEYSDKTINQHECIITINKVEFADKETRVYVTASNNSSDNFDIYTYSAKIVQDHKQYEQSDNFNADYPSLQTDLLPNTISEGILTFPAIPQATFELIIDGDSDNWKIDIGAYKFKLDVE